MQRVHNIIILILMISARTLWWTAVTPCSEQALESGKDHLHIFKRFQGQYHEIFCLRFFHESSSPKPLKITLGSFPIFSNICKSRCTSSINDTGGKFATSVNDTGGAPWTANISTNFRKIRNGAALMGYTGAWGKLIYGKKPKVEYLVALSL